MSILDAIGSRTSVGGILSLILGVYIINWAFRLVTDQLKDIPGPWMARFTRLWLLRQYVKGDFQKTNTELHERYGSIVRIAPNTYSVDSPEAAKVIYGHGSQFKKSSWYTGFNSTEANIFSEQDPHIHSLMRRKVASAYSMSSLVSYEPLIDETTQIFLQKLSELSASGAAFNMGHWFQCYAFETIGMITFSKRFGFLDKGEDIHGIMGQLDFGALYSSAVGLIASWHPILFAGLTLLNSEAQGIGFVDNYARGLIASQKHEKSPQASGPADFITKFLTIQREDPAKMPDKDLRSAINANMAAGSDTTSITLSAILYHLIRNPETLRKLRQELDDASSDGRISDPITFKEAQELPYLQAVIKESMRIHPATGYTMPRVVPEGGREIEGRHFPGGAVVGINSWVAHRNRAVFGEDAGIFRPERWLEDEESSSQREAYYLPFGLGSRTCIGKNISLLEISKAIPQVIRHLDFELQNDGNWDVVTHWFTKPKSFICKVKQRNT